MNQHFQERDRTNARTVTVPSGTAVISVPTNVCTLMNVRTGAAIVTELSAALETSM